MDEEGVAALSEESKLYAKYGEAVAGPFANQERSINAQDLDSAWKLGNIVGTTAFLPPFRKFSHEEKRQ